MPTVSSTATDNSNSSNNTACPVNIPSGTASGDLLVLFAFVNNLTSSPGASNPFTTPSGWTLLGFSTETGAAGGGKQETSALYHKTASGSETDFDITVSENDTNASICVRAADAVINDWALNRDAPAPTYDSATIDADTDDLLLAFLAVDEFGSHQPQYYDGTSPSVVQTGWTAVAATETASDNVSNQLHTRTAPSTTTYSHQWDNGDGSHTNYSSGSTENYGHMAILSLSDSAVNVTVNAVTAAGTLAMDVPGLVISPTVTAATAAGTLSMDAPSVTAEQNVTVNAVTAAGTLAMDAPAVAITEKWEVYTDDFTSHDTGIWSDWGGAQTTFASDGLTIVNPSSDTNYYGITSSGVLTGTLEDSEIVTKVADHGDQSLVSWEIIPVMATQDGNSARIIVNQEQIVTRRTGRSDTTTFLGAPLPLYYRLRETGGTLYYEYSDDAASWTVEHSEATPFALDDCYIDIYVGTWQNEASSTSVLFEGFNLSFQHATVTAVTSEGTLSMDAPGVTAEQNIDISAVTAEATLSMDAPAVITDPVVSAVTAEGTLSADAPTPAIGVPIPTAEVVGAMDAPVVETITLITAAASEATLSMDAPTFTIDGDLSAVTAEATLSMDAPSLSVGTLISGATAEGTLSADAPAVTITATIAVPSAEGTLSADAPTIHVDVDITAATAAGTLSMDVPTTALFLPSPTAAGTLSSDAPTISVSVTAVVMVGTLSMDAPTLDASINYLGFLRTEIILLGRAEGSVSLGQSVQTEIATLGHVDTTVVARNPGADSDSSPFATGTTIR